MIQAKDALKPYKSNANSNFPAQIAQDLNLNQTDTDALIELLTPIFNEEDLLSQAQALLDNLQKQCEDLAKDSALSQDQFNQAITEQTLANNRIEANAQVSQQFSEPQITDSYYTNTIDLPPADSGFGEDYPNSYGNINDIGDFFKINKTNGILTLQHHSGTALKIDNQGNVTIHTKGTTKFITQGDLAIQSQGALDISSKKGLYIHSNEITIKADSQLVLDTLQIQATNTMQFDLSQSCITTAGTFKGYALLSAPAISLA